jgi:two-component system, OmpR family, KDP operon response regulator KdpE
VVADKTVVLIVEDDQNIVDLVRSNLSARGHDVIVSKDGTGVSEVLQSRGLDVVLLDLMLPGRDGFELCQEIREQSGVGIIVLSARRAETDKVRALNLGADDYMTKPFGMRELNARLRVALRHHAVAGEDQAELHVGPLHLDLVHCEATLDGRVLDLTAKEFDFLAFLARHAGKVCTRRMILESVWGSQYARDMQYLKVYAYRIRRKLGDEGGQILQSDPSVGYRLMPPGETSPVS